MTATADAPERPADIDPDRQRKMLLGAYAIFAGAVVPILVYNLVSWGLLPSELFARLEEWEVYRFLIPMFAATVIMAVFGVLTFLIRKPWPPIGALVASVLLVVSYMAPMMQLGQSPWTFIGFVLLAIPIILTATLFKVHSTIRALPPVDLQKPSEIKQVGTLRYTAFGIGMMFFWLLWGDFAYTLFDTNMPNILVLKLKDMGASDTLNTVLNKTFSYAVVFLFAPAVSFRSDRHRGRWGRRMPFLIWSTPFVGLFIVLMGLYEPITHFFTGGAPQVQVLGFTISDVGVALIVFGVLFVAYDFANIFVGTVYWYLFNDVVPTRMLSQFMSCFRIVGTLAGIIYSKWIFPNALIHFQTLFIVGGICYVLAFMAMCFMVKEGKYPPPPPLQSRPTGQAERFFRRLVTQYYRQPGWAFLAACIVPVFVFSTLTVISKQALDANMAVGEWARQILPLLLLSVVFATAGILAWTRNTTGRNIFAAVAGLALSSFYFISAWMRQEQIPANIGIVMALPALVAILLPIGWLVQNRSRRGQETVAVDLPQSRLGQVASAVPGGFGRWFDNFQSQAETYAKECFTHKFYWYFFLQSMFFFVSWQTGHLGTLRNRDSLNLTMQQIGDLGAITAAVSLLLQYPAGWLADKWNPIRVFTFTTFVTFGQNIFQCIFIFTNFTPSTNLLIMYWLAFTLMPFVVLHSAAEIPMYMRLLPKERYGQFCSANAMVRSFALIFGSILAGYFMDSLKTRYPDDFHYRFYPVWAVAFQVPAFFFLWLLYREWLRLGGDKNYVPPQVGTSQSESAADSSDAPPPRAH